MKPDLNSIENQSIHTFYELYWPQHRILIDFFNLLPEDQYDFCLVQTANTKSDTPRESLAHIIYVQWVYLNGVKTGTLEFKSMGTEHFSTLSKEALLAELERCDVAINSYLTSETFDSSCSVGVPWGGSMNAVDLLFFLRDHDILHIGWNLAMMDLHNVPRYASLSQYWDKSK
jgi:uncharacterized damage-inducible protein DinB